MDLQEVINAFAWVGVGLGTCLLIVLVEKTLDFLARHGVINRRFDSGDWW